MAEPKEKSTEERRRALLKEVGIMFAVATVFFLLWGWLTSVDAVAWLHPFLLAVAIIFSIVGIYHLVMQDMLRYGFKQ
jgi:hypothetical protein